MDYGTVTKASVIEKCKGFLLKELYVVFTTPAMPLEEMRKVTPDHLAYQVDLERRGIMWAAGPLIEGDEVTWRGEGMIVYRAESLAAARAIAEADPMHSRGARTFTVRPWLVNEGSLTVRINFSDQSAEII